MFVTSAVIFVAMVRTLRRHAVSVASGIIIELFTTTVTGQLPKVFAICNDSQIVYKCCLSDGFVSLCGQTVFSLLSRTRREAEAARRRDSDLRDGTTYYYVYK